MTQEGGLQRILVVEDDARWIAGLPLSSARLHFAHDLQSGLRLIDKRRRWNGAIFDRYLTQGNSRISLKSIRSNAGFILAAEFLNKFPGGRVCVVSGDANPDTVHPPLRRLLDLENCHFLFKGRRRSQDRAMSFVLSGEYESSPVDLILEFLLLQPNFFGLGVNLENLIQRLRS